MPLTSFTAIDGSTIDFATIRDPDLKARVMTFLSTPSNSTDWIIGEAAAGYYRQFIKPTDANIVDLGANIGVFSLFVAPQCNTLLSVEPFAAHFDLLAALSTQFVPLRVGHHFLKAAVGAVDQEAAPFYVRPENSAMNGLDHGSESTYSKADQTVEVVSLNTLLTHYKDNSMVIDFAKIDIEGAEYKAFQSVDRKLLKTWCKSLLVECHNNAAASRGETMELVGGVLHGVGYTVREVNEATLFAE